MKSLCKTGAALLSLALAVQATVISGKINDLTGAIQTSNRSVRFVLQNCGNNLPRVVGSSVLVPASLTIAPNAAGNLAGTVVGNDIIECGTTIGQTYYQVSIFSGTLQVYQNTYSITGPTWNITTANPLSNDPTAFLNYTGYLLGDLIYGAGTNTLGLVRGNTSTQKMTLTMTGDGTHAGMPDWSVITNDMLPSSIATSLSSLSLATSLDTPSTIVTRDGAGNFSAGTITANLTGNITGNASSVTNGLYSSGSYNNPAWLTGLAASKVSGLATVSTSGNYTDLLGKPTIPSSTDQITEGSHLYFTNARAVSAMAGLYQTPITGSPGTWPGFAAVATSGSYSDLSNKPTLTSLGGFANPMTASGDFIVQNGAGPSRLTAPGDGTYCPSWATGVVTWVSCPGATGGISSITLAVPAGFSASPSPLTANGTLTVSLSSQTAHFALLAPTGGGVPTWRALVASDIPALSYQGPITAGTTAQYLRGDLSLATFAHAAAHAGGATDAITSLGAISYTGGLTWSTDNTFDIGSSGVNRPRNVYVAGQYNGSGAGLIGVPWSSLTGVPSSVGLWQLNGSNLYYSSGNIGIGTTIPPAPLTVSSPSAVYSSTVGQFQVSDNANTNRQLRFGYDSTLEAGWTQAAKAGTFEPLLLNPNGGNVGIGTTTPNAVLSLGSAAQTNKLYLYDLNGNTDKYGLGMASSTLQVFAGVTGGQIAFGKYDGTTFTEYGRWNNGNFGVGVNPALPLHVSTPWQQPMELDYTNNNVFTTSPFNSGTIIFKNNSSTAGNGANFMLNNIGGSPTAAFTLINVGTAAFPNNGGAFAWSTYDGVGGGGTVKMYLNSVGNLGLGLTNPTYQLQLSTDSAAKPSTSTWTVASDARVKTNVRPFTDGLDIINQLKPITYEYNGKAGLPAGASGVSFIAQDVQPVAPYMVGSYKAKLNPEDTEPTDILNLQTHYLPFILINAIHDLEKQTLQPKWAEDIRPVCSEMTRGQSWFIKDDLLGDRIEMCGKSTQAYSWKVTTQF